MLLWALVAGGSSGVAFANDQTDPEPSSTPGIEAEASDASAPVPQELAVEEPSDEPAAPVPAPDRLGDAGVRAESADEAARVRADADTTAWHRKPVPTMFKSVLVPGWGQWSNGKRVKAGAFFLTEGYFFYRAARAAQKEWDLEDQGLDAEALSWNEERRDYTWWLLFVVILSMGDAYVDAHLRGFDAEFEPTETGGRAGFRWTF
ncbi:MAG: hypothetical protein R3E97_07830 [Candidatus Eisenbacteria bacterium]